MGIEYCIEGANSGETLTSLVERLAGGRAGHTNSLSLFSFCLPLQERSPVFSESPVFGADRSDASGDGKADCGGVRGLAPFASGGMVVGG